MFTSKLLPIERFITQELKAEASLLTAHDRLTALNMSSYRAAESIAAEVTRVQKAASAVAETDVLAALAETASKNNYCMPEVDVSGIIDIKDGRHPVVERTHTDGLFVPNDVFLDCGSNRTAIITGPNMAGKSTICDRLP